uniref:SXP/RAL-2 family protein Ani s 5-like cation-binding domain-containing protein n=1 Tax=Meloidogyne javanica TaxID=6303 RepID=A0A915LHD0_MELJA
MPRKSPSIPPSDYSGGNNDYAQVNGQRKGPMPYGNGYNPNEGKFGQQNLSQNQQQQKMKGESGGSGSDEESFEGDQNFSQGQRMPEGQKFGNFKNEIGGKNSENNEKYGRNQGNDFEQTDSFGRQGMNDRPPMRGSMKNGFGGNPQNNGLNEDNGYPGGFERDGIKTNFDRRGNQGNGQFEGNPSQEMNPFGRGQNPLYGVPGKQNMQGNSQFQEFPGNKNMNFDGNPESKNGGNEVVMSNGSEENEQLDEQEKQFLFQIYPFLKNVTVESILSFRTPLRDIDLSKADLEKKREEWLQKESEEIKKAYTDWKQRLNDKKQIANEKNAKNVETSSADTQELYKTIMETIADQTVSRHQECVNIRDSVKAASTETRNEFRQKVKLRVINFCLEEEEKALSPANPPMPGQNSENSLAPSINIENGADSSESGEENEDKMKNDGKMEEKNPSKDAEVKEAKNLEKKQDIGKEGEDENEEKKMDEDEKDEEEGKDVKMENKEESGPTPQNDEDNDEAGNDEDEAPEVNGKD